MNRQKYSDEPGFDFTASSARWPKTSLDDLFRHQKSKIDLMPLKTHNRTITNTMSSSDDWTNPSSSDTTSDMDFESQPVTRESYRDEVDANYRLRRKTGRILIGTLAILVVASIAALVFLFVLPSK